MKKLITLCLLLVGAAFSHPFYLSVTDLKYNATEQTVQGSVKIFINDLESALKKTQHKTVDLIHVKDTVQTNSILYQYLNMHLSMNLNGRIRTFRLLGFECEEEAIWLYIEFAKCEAPKKIELRNTLLFEDIREQTNIVRLKVDGSEKSLKATNPEKTFIFDF